MLEDLSRFRRDLLAWYHRGRRDLPWRVPPGSPPGARPDPYRVLVSEAMLQQTQVATVIPYFQRFIARLPTLEALAAADEQEVLRLWQGLGYYRRARNLHAAARAVVERHGGALPASVEALLELPGVGRYTAGAIASLAFGLRAPILDGNVARVLCRLDLVEEDPARPAVRERLWARALEVLPRRSGKADPGDVNSALMELGATVCAPRNPRCLTCPVAACCAARAAGAQDRIPPPRTARARPVECRVALAIRRAVNGAAAHYLVERRPADGRWGGMWQFVTVAVEGPDERVTPALVRRLAGVSVRELAELGAVTHDLTHRRYEFAVYAAEAEGEETGGREGRAWVTLEGLEAYPLPRPHLRIAAMLRQER